MSPCCEFSMLSVSFHNRRTEVSQSFPTPHPFLSLTCVKTYTTKTTTFLSHVQSNVSLTTVSRCDVLCLGPACSSLQHNRHRAPYPSPFFPCLVCLAPPTPRHILVGQVSLDHWVTPVRAPFPLSACCMPGGGASSLLAPAPTSLQMFCFYFQANLLECRMAFWRTWRRYVEHKRNVVLAVL